MYIAFTCIVYIANMQIVQQRKGWWHKSIIMGHDMFYLGLYKALKMITKLSLNNHLALYIAVKSYLSTQLNRLRLLNCFFFLLKPCSKTNQLRGLSISFQLGRKIKLQSVYWNHKTSELYSEHFFCLCFVSSQLTRFS